MINDSIIYFLIHHLKNMFVIVVIVEYSTIAILVTNNQKAIIQQFSIFSVIGGSKFCINVSHLALICITLNAVYIITCERLDNL